uniref:uncharacterized protein LOC105349843 n=1 Tax=Fragaria vesca subsp. vesca TaxID=101020 RepID=UPI0005C87C59|nr:PREDICTED: uncharacterized protein LOC105349843 [Fragaria vesca subsp. vesca]
MEHGSKSLVTEKRLLKEIKGIQKQKEKDSLALLCTQCRQCEADIAYATEHLRRTGNYTRHRMYHNWWWHIARYQKFEWVQGTFTISRGGTKDRGGEIRDLECSIEKCGVVLLEKADKTPTANDKTGNASPTLVMGKTWTSLVSKNALEEQIKLAGEEIEESRKTLLALGHGPKSGEAQRNLVGVEKELSDPLMKLPGLRRKRIGLHQCILDLITKQQA